MRLLFMLFSLLCLVLPAYADAPAATHHFFWRVSRGHEVMYLIGSVHALNPDDYPLPAGMESALRRCDALVEEIDLTSLNPFSFQKETLKLGVYPAGESLQTQLPAATYADISAAAVKTGVQLASLQRLRPWLASLTVTNAALAKIGITPNDGVDMHFANEAQMLHIPVIGLETPEYQLQLLADLPEAAQEQDLLQTLNETPGIANEIQLLIHDWENGDTAALEQEMHRELDPYPQIYQALLVNRNRAWLPKLEALLASGKTYLVVVGALHFVGPDGLIAGFEKAGYKTEQL